MISAVNYADYLEATANQIDRQRNREKTRLLLLVATARFLDQNSYSEMSVKEIVRGANTSHGTFYIYFKDKQTATIELLSSFVDFEMQTMPVYDAKLEPIKIRLMFTSWYHDTFRVNIGLMRTMVLLSDTIPEIATIWRRRGKEMVGRSLQYYRQRYDFSDEQLNLLRVSHHALGSMADHSLFARFGLHGAAETSEERDEAFLIELHATLAYRGLFGEDPPLDGLKVAQAMSDIRKKFQQPKI
jgi:AcrR family transcriptional regulator